MTSLPVDGSTGISVNTSVQIVFSEDVVGVSTTSFTLVSASNTIPGTIASTNGATYAFQPNIKRAA